MGLSGRLPQRWAELDQRTIEMIARMNEDERRHWIELANLDDKQVERLKQFLSLPDDKWEAGFKIVTRSAVISATLRKVPRFVLGLAAILVAVDQIWKYLAPYVLRGIK